MMVFDGEKRCNNNENENASVRWKRIVVAGLGAGLRTSSSAYSTVCCWGVGAGGVGGGCWAWR
jgi:hypothetical protein